MRHLPRTIARVVVTLFLGLAGLSSLTSCGGGPNVASATGHYIYLASSNGIYGFSLMSNNTLSPLSNSALASGAYTAIIVDPTPGGISSPVLYAVNSGTSISSFPINGNGTLGTPTSLSPTSCLTDYSGLSVTADGNWLLAVDNLVATNNIAAINLKTDACGTVSSVDSSNFPITLAVNCTLSGGSCNVLVTEAPTASSSTPSTQVLIPSWSSSNGTFSGTTTTLSGLGATAQSVIFDTATLFFYLTAPSSNLLGSLVSAPSTSTAFTSTLSFSTITSTPCLDVLNNALYLPTTNGSVYQFGVDTAGGIQSASQLWSLSSTPSIPTIYACAILD
jgi:hypothetical protein